MMTNFHLNTTVVAIFPNVCLWRRSLCSDLVLTLKNRFEPPSHARTAYVVAIWPSFLFDSFVKIQATCETFLGKRFTAPPPPTLGKKFPVRLCLPVLKFSAVPYCIECIEGRRTHTESDERWFKMLSMYNPQSVNTQHTTRRKGKIDAKANCNH